MERPSDTSPKPLPFGDVNTVEPTDTCLELRIHGIGDHDYLSSLGSPPLTEDRPSSEPNTATPPIVPSHTLRLLAWSGMSRRVARFRWFLALPFTFVNVAGHMHPPTTAHWSIRFLHGLAVFITGLATTVAAYLWSIALSETFFRDLTVPSPSVVDGVFATAPAWNHANGFNTHSQNVALVSVLIPTLVFATLLVCRCASLLWRRRSDSPVFLAVMTSFQLLGVALAFCILMWRPPTFWAWPPAGTTMSAVLSPFSEVLRVWRPRPSFNDDFFKPERPSQYDIEKICRAATDPSDRQKLEQRLDPMNGVVLGSMVIVLVPALGLALSAFRRTSTSGAAYAGSALILMASILSLHAFWSSVNLGLEWLLEYLDMLSVAPIADGGGVRNWDRHLLAFQGSGSCQLSNEFINNTAFLALIGVTLPAVTFAASNLIGPQRIPWQVAAVALLSPFITFGSRFAGSRGRRWRLWKIVERRRLVHQLVLNLGTWRLPFAFTTGSVGGMVAMSYYLERTLSSGVIDDIGKVVSHALAALALIYFVTRGRIHWARTLVSNVADVVGFWRAAWHPLSGQSYLPSLLRGLDRELGKSTAPAVLVGHSQGSVVAAWFVGHHASMRPLGLVTCGSPLFSLYQRFFPAYFDQTFFERVSRRWWVNVWRDTDPISTKVTCAKNVRLEDPPEGAVSPRGHGDYWIEAEQMRLTRRVLRVVERWPLAVALKKHRDGSARVRIHPA